MVLEMEIDMDFDTPDVLQVQTANNSDTTMYTEHSSTGTNSHSYYGDNAKLEEDSCMEDYDLGNSHMEDSPTGRQSHGGFRSRGQPQGS